MGGWVASSEEWLGFDDVVGDLGGWAVGPPRGVVWTMMEATPMVREARTRTYTYYKHIYPHKENGPAA